MSVHVAISENNWCFDAYGHYRQPPTKKEFNFLGIIHAYSMPNQKKMSNFGGNTGQHFYIYLLRFLDFFFQKYQFGIRIGILNFLKA